MKKMILITLLAISLQAGNYKTIEIKSINPYGMSWNIKGENTTVGNLFSDILLSEYNSKYYFKLIKSNSIPLELTEEQYLKIKTTMGL